MFVRPGRLPDVSDRPRPRSTRDRPAKAPLSEGVVIDAGLRILQREGLDAVTMRRVATDLDTGPASLYVYVKGRDELCRALLDRVVGMVPLEAPDPERWREQLNALLSGMLAALEAHPGVARAALAAIPTGESSLLLTEAMLGILRAGGIGDQAAAWACDVLPTLVVAAAIETATDQERDAAATGADPLPAIRDVVAGLSPRRFPNMTGLADELANGDGDVRFAFAVDTFVDGLVAGSARRATG